MTVGNPSEPWLECAFVLRLKQTAEHDFQGAKKLVLRTAQKQHSQFSNRAKLRIQMAMRLEKRQKCESNIDYVNLNLVWVESLEIKSYMA